LKQDSPFKVLSFLVSDSLTFAANSLNLSTLSAFIKYAKLRLKFRTGTTSHILSKLGECLHVQWMYDVTELLYIHNWSVWVKRFCMQLLVLACEVEGYSVACIKHVSRLIERYRNLNYNTIIFNSENYDLFISISDCY